MSIKEVVLRIMLKPAKNIYSSQTGYETLLAYINMYKATNDEKYLQCGLDISKTIIHHQLSNGGFDIGYNFKFGENIKKSTSIQATTPEILSVYALIELYKIRPDDSLKESIEKGMNWLKGIIRQDGEYWVAPYAPDTLDFVYITNAISFCIGTIANYVSVFHDESYVSIYRSMCDYMLYQLTIENDKGYWPYFERDFYGRSHLYFKVDNYHNAQQLYYHFIANKMIPCESNTRIIGLLENYLLGELEKNIMVPYMYYLDDNSISRNYDLWGYSAILSCMAIMGHADLAKKLCEVIATKGWNDTHFNAILDCNGNSIDSNFYPRSDAWVVHAFSEYYLTIQDSGIRRIIDTDLNELDECRYKGRENHALTKKKEILSTFVNVVKKKK